MKTIIRHSEEERVTQDIPGLSYLKDVFSESTFEDEASFVRLPFENNLSELEQLISERAHSVKEIILVGIGGSNLGFEALYSALGKTLCRVTFLESLSVESLLIAEERVRSSASSDEYLIFIISKSGKTLETLVNAETLASRVLSAGDDAKTFFSRFVVLTEEGSPLWMSARAQDMSVVSLEKAVGGRFSVFSPVGLLPMLVCGFDVRDFLKGGQDATHNALNEGAEGVAFKSASFLFDTERGGYTNHDMFIFDTRLEKLGYWYRQLLAESLGKDGKGITPSVSLGSRDLHSVAQLTLDGPKKTSTLFLSASFGEQDIIPTSHFFLKDNKMEGRGVRAVNSLLLEATQRAYLESSLPFIEYVFEDKSLIYEIGYWMQTKMIEVFLLGRMWGVNPFGQDAVELYKKEVRKILDV